MDTQKYRKQLELIPNLHLAYAGLLLLGAIGVLVAMERTETVAAYFQLMAIAVTLLAMCLVAVMAAVELRHRMGLGRILALALAIPSLFLFPIGTAMGLYSVWVLMAPEAEGQFFARREEAPA